MEPLHTPPLPSPSPPPLPLRHHNQLEDYTRLPPPVPCPQPPRRTVRWPTTVSDLCARFLTLVTRVVIFRGAPATTSTSPFTFRTTVRAYTGRVEVRGKVAGGG